MKLKDIKVGEVYAFGIRRTARHASEPCEVYARGKVTAVGVRSERYAGTWAARLEATGPTYVEFEPIGADPPRYELEVRTDGELLKRRVVGFRGEELVPGQEKKTVYRAPSRECLMLASEMDAIVARHEDAEEAKERRKQEKLARFDRALEGLHVTASYFPRNRNEIGDRVTLTLEDFEKLAARAKLAPTTPKDEDL